MTTLTCTSCKQPTTNSTGNTKFKCPKCSEYVLVRCAHCRIIAAPYSCVCGFTGPN